MSETPVREIRTILNDSGQTSYVNRILIGTATTGLVRTEWVAARYSQIVPMNWSQVQINQVMSGYFAQGWMVADAQNIIVRQALDGDFEWLFLLEHDNVIPDNTLIQLDEYMREARIPVVSGLYYSRSRPSRPLVFRGRGTGVYAEWEESPGKAKPGQELIWCDGVPTGCLLIHSSILKLMWMESPEYLIRRADGGLEVTRRVFSTPRSLILDGKTHNIISGTSDLDWCDRVMKEDVFQRAGWKDHCPDPRWPFLVDARLFSRHINMNGEQFP